MSHKIYMIAGEASGDLHGANLIHSLLKIQPDLVIRGWGGDRMKAAGANVVKHYKDLAFMGFIEVVLNLKTILKNLSFCKSDILEFNPNTLILIDYPGFNLRIAKWAFEQKINVIYYISPQIWAWKKNRVYAIRKHVNRMFVILPFEKAFYGKYNMDVDFVGHPLLDEIEAFKTKSLSRADFLSKNNLPDQPLIAVLPGSRKQEISKMLPVMLSVANRFDTYRFVIAGSSSLPQSIYMTEGKAANISLVTDQTYDLFNHAYAGIITSGTATLEAALFNLPEVVCYKGSSISIAIARRLVNIKYISLVNLIMDEEVVIELIQNDLTTQTLSHQLQLLLNPENRDVISRKYHQLHQKLGGAGASNRVAREVLKTIER